MVYSPLRYPGGKSKITPLIRTMIEMRGLGGGVYIEPFAGGAGVALELLEKGVISEIVINDYDKGIASFWKASIYDSERFIETIYETPITIEEWKRQRSIYINQSDRYSFDLGFATFYLNRTNRSGIIKGGVIGGVNQSGEWKIDARFCKDELVRRIRAIAQRKHSIHVYNKDICSFIDNYASKYQYKSFIYFDPPYYKKGKQLYLNYFDHNDHVKIEERIRMFVKSDWVMTYDLAPEIIEIYKGHSMRKYDLNYSAAKKRRASELLILKSDEMLPDMKSHRDLQKKIWLRRI